MELWDADYFDSEVEAFIEFRDEGDGWFQFGMVRGAVDYRPSECDDEPNRVEWSWDGADEDDRVCGRGWAEIEKEGTLRGKIFIHRVDESEFTARRA
jgi:hypothetical protein